MHQHRKMEPVDLIWSSRSPPCSQPPPEHTSSYAGSQRKPLHFSWKPRFKKPRNAGWFNIQITFCSKRWMRGDFSSLLLKHIRGLCSDKMWLMAFFSGKCPAFYQQALNELINPITAKWSKVYPLQLHWRISESIIAIGKPARFLVNFHTPWAYQKLSNQRSLCSPWVEWPALQGPWSQNIWTVWDSTEQLCWNGVQSNMTGATRVWPCTADPFVLFCNAVFLGWHSQGFLPALSWYLPWGHSHVVPSMTVQCSYKRIAQTAVYTRILATLSTGNGEGKNL